LQNQRWPNPEGPEWAHLHKLSFVERQAASPLHPFGRVTRGPHVRAKGFPLSDPLAGWQPAQTALAGRATRLPLCARSGHQDTATAWPGPLWGGVWLVWCPSAMRATNVSAP
jgi:hypothetical protein